MTKPKSLYNHPKKKKKMRRSEQLLQIGVMNFVRRVMELDKYKRFICFHVPNGGGRSKAEGSIFKAMGVMAGVADLVILIAANKVHAQPTTIFIEMKAKDGDLSDSQIWFEDTVCAMGFKYYIIEAPNPNAALSMFIEIMKENGVRL